MDSAIDTPFGAMVAALPAAAPGGLRLAERCDLALVSVLARPGREAAAAADLARLSHLVAVGPGNWLGAGVAGDVATPGVAVFDQRAAFALLEIVGADALKLLQKGVFVDLAVHLGSDGASLCSIAARINITIWRITADRLLIAVPRSFAASFWHWLTAAAATEAIPLGR